jgi:hypothetical protein
MSDDSRESYRETLHSNIAWNGHQLDGIESLVCDLTFRRVMTWAFSPARPVDSKTLKRLIGDRGTANRSQFEELLDRAILRALGTGTFFEIVRENEQAAPTRLFRSNFQNDGTPHDDDGELQLRKTQIWAARFIVFDHLIADLDFQEYVLECDEDKGWWEKVLEWGKQLRLPASPGRPEGAKDTTPGPVWDGLFRPILHSLVYVVPIAIGAGSVGTYIIERQSEIRMAAPTIENSIPPMAVTNNIPAATIQNNIPPATIENNLPPMTVQNILPPPSFLTISDGPGQTASPKIDASQCKSCTTAFQPTIHLTFDDDQWKQFSGLMKALPPITIRLGNERTEKSENRDKDMNGAKPSPVGTSSATAPQNTNGAATATTTQNTSTTAQADQTQGSSAAARLNLNLDLSELNVKQQLYPLEMIPPTHVVAARRPELIVVDGKPNPVPYKIDKGSPAKPATTSPNASKESESDNKAYFYLCDWRVPVRFVVGIRTPASQSDCSSTDLSASNLKLYVFTRTAQYVPEIDAYVSLDEASRRRFLLLGSRRIVLQVVPNVAETAPTGGTTGKGN